MNVEQSAQSGMAPAVHDAGSGSVLVLLHGLSGTWEMWKPILATLEAKHRVIAITLPGHHGGPAFAGQGDATIAALADQLVSMLRSQGIDTAHVAGNSLGGWLSLELARRGFARSVVAFSPAGGWRSDADYWAIAKPFRIFYALADLNLFLLKGLARFAWVRRVFTKTMMEHGERLSVGEFTGLLRAMSETNVLPGLLRSMGRDGSIAPFATDIPITIAWGEKDRVIPYERYGIAFPERIVGIKETVVTGAGHVPMWDNPEQVAAQILAMTGAVDGNSALLSVKAG
jgi:pimeloyl-ACP methyl ester carboxylesterase